MKNCKSFVLTVFLVFISFYTNADGITSISKTNKFLKDGQEAFKNKDFKTAIKAYESALKESSEVPPQANLNLASAYFQTKEYAKAQKNYMAAATAINSPGLKSMAYQQIGNILSEQKDYKSALDWYKKSLKANPENESARFNYELAYKLNKKKEDEQKKNDPKQDQNKEDKKDKKQEEKQKEENKDQKQGKKEENGQKDKQEDNKGQKPGQQKDDKGKPDDKGKDGKDAKKGDDPNAPDSDKESDIGKEKNKEEKDNQGKEESKTKKDESNADDPNAVRLDKKKLQETGLSEEQAKSLLEAMKQSEVKYLQQRRFKSPKGGQDKNKPRW